MLRNLLGGVRSVWVLIAHRSPHVIVCSLVVTDALAPCALHFTKIVDFLIINTSIEIAGIHGNVSQAKVNVGK